MRVFLSIMNYSENEQVFLKQFDSWELTEEQRQKIYQDFLIYDEYAMNSANERISLYEEILENFERLVIEKYSLTQEQATAIKIEGLIRDWADLLDKKEQKKSTFFSKVLSCLTNIKEKFL